MKFPGLIFASLFLLSNIADAAQPTKPLACASAKGIRTEKEFKSVKGQKTYVVNVTFVGRQPSRREIDHILRDCLASATKVDSSRDILGTAWLRKDASANSSDDEIINNYGVLKYLSYEASTKTIDVRQIRLISK
jgi:hypothetical protein